MQIGLLDTDNELIYINDITTFNKHFVCPRLYFYIRILGLITSQPILNLIFGRAWHAAKRYLLIKGLSQDNLDGAMSAFHNIFDVDYSPAQWDVLAPKNPIFARESLELYIEQYKNRPREILATEHSGNIFINEQDTIFIKLDVIEKDITDGKIWIVDHKTTGNRNPIYADILRLSNQMTTYMAGANMYFENVGGVRIERSVFLKSEVSHSDYYIYNNPVEVMMILNSLRSEMETLKRNWDLLLNHDINHLDEVQQSFPVHTESCIQYFRMCEYRNLCLSCPNILALNNIPLGFKQEFWNPLKDEGSLDE
jgi:hypothetical protein